MSQEWIDIQSFFMDQNLLQGITDVSIAIKQDLAGIRDPERQARGNKAKENLRRFFNELEELTPAKDQDAILGVNSRSKELLNAFASARCDTANFHSVLMRAGPKAGLTLLDADDTHSKKELLSSLAELRKVVARHQQTDVSAIFEDF